MDEFSRDVGEFYISLYDGIWAGKLNFSGFFFINEVVALGENDKYYGVFIL